LNAAVSERENTLATGQTVTDRGQTRLIPLR
jgi:hypothetical protein